ncbi:hypothetical protein ElyMa_002536500 [Elysia marginata]|uniref:C-type lectin domain-containing protein n=1 Tax=Elysia marginata TaxID=1093978 RepID=A0AAV4GV60_9GAST|nr:hypothetical protein ElyMa_002536500 [Elysia marginata]
MVVSVVLLLTLMISPCQSLISNTTIDSGTCVCNTEDAALYTKAGYEHPIRRYLLRNHCMAATGASTTIFGEAWFEITVDDQDLWTSGDYLAYAPGISGKLVCLRHLLLPRHSSIV